MCLSLVHLFGFLNECLDFRFSTQRMNQMATARWLTVRCLPVKPFLTLSDLPWVAYSVFETDPLGSAVKHVLLLSGTVSLASEESQEVYSELLQSDLGLILRVNCCSNYFFLFRVTHRYLLGYHLVLETNKLFSSDLIFAKWNYLQAFSLVWLLIDEVSISHSDAPQSVRLLWTSGQIVAETSTGQHTTLTTDIHAPEVGFEPTISAGERPQTYALDRAATGTGM